MNRDTRQRAEENGRARGIPNRTDRCCPLCGGRDFSRSWLAVSFNDAEYDFPECRTCGSLICDPMPDAAVLAAMYGNDYCGNAESAGEDTSLEKFGQVLDFLSSLPAGTFIDYGCGDGRLLLKVKAMGWKVTGVDFNPELAAALESQDIEVVGPEADIEMKADVVHLGDVLEHLTDLEGEFPKILDLVKEDGYVVAHGPLEANRNLFYRALRLGKRLRGRVTSMPPYHVILATTRGQRSFFEGSGLREMEWTVQEVAFPAKPTLSLSDLAEPRTTALYVLRKLSQLTSRGNVENLGNRFFYVGRLPQSARSGK